jgi:hypothetical protein
MIDYYNLPKIVEAHQADAVKAAEQERLASQAATPDQDRPAAERGAAERLRALARAGAHRLETAAGPGEC